MHRGMARRSDGSAAAHLLPLVIVHVWVEFIDVVRILAINGLLRRKDTRQESLHHAAETETGLLRRKDTHEDSLHHDSLAADMLWDAKWWTCTLSLKYASLSFGSDNFFDAPAFDP